MAFRTTIRVGGKTVTATKGTTMTVYLGKRYTNYVGRKFVRCAVHEGGSEYAIIDVCIREGRNSIQHLSTAAEIKQAAQDLADDGHGLIHPAEYINRCKGWFKRELPESP